LRSNLLTLFFAGLIILSGFLLPTLFFPSIDVQQGEIFRLDPPPDTTLAKRVFEDPVSLYPWNVYDEQRLRPLTASEEDLLISRGIPDFLLATLRDYGWKAEEDLSSYRNAVTGSFRYLDPSSSMEQGCFVLVDADIDLDGQKDLTCAVDQQGNVIEVLFLGDDWDPIQIDAPVGQPITAPITPDEGEADGTVESDGTDDPTALLFGQEEGDAPSEGDTPPSQNPGDPNKQGVGPTGGVGPNQEDLSHRPIDEERNLWSFAYVISREAHVINQQSLYFAFRQLELNYENRYGYAYTALFPIPSEEIEELPAVEYVTLTAIDFVAQDSILYIYNLSSDERLILYLDPTTMHCKGFNLLRY
jgi:hypothetical protein